MINQENINMIGDPAIYLSPFSTHQIDIWGERFSTAEHAYQWKKFKDLDIKNKIKEAKSPLLAWEIAQKYKNISECIDGDFDKDETMEILFRQKVLQHNDVLKILLNTADLNIVKIHPEDSYWGINEEGIGKNMMGKLWMKIRDEYKNKNVTK